MNPPPQTPLNISIFGLGYVGAVTAGCLARNGHQVIGVDPDTRKLEFLRQGKPPIQEQGVDDLIGQVVADGALTVSDDPAQAVAQTRMSLVCVGTPSAADGSLGTEYLTRVCEQIGRAIAGKSDYHTVVIRSTVAPGTTREVVRPILERESGGRECEQFGLAMNPEFLREGTSIKDFYQPPFTVIGADNAAIFEQVSRLYDQSGGEVIHCSIPAAESIKYACNLFHAAKITFANEIGMVCKTAGVDAREVMDIVCRDTKLNISSKYLRPGFAFGGSCLPKDLRALSALARSHNTPLNMIESMLVSNAEQVRRVTERIMAMGRRPIALMGISFKEGTDDLRESPLVTLAEGLIGKGYQPMIFDPNVEYAALFGSNKRFIDQELPHLKKALVSAEVALEHAEILVFGHHDPIYEKLIDRIRPDQTVFDLVGITEPVAVAGTYEGLYW